MRCELVVRKHIDVGEHHVTQCRPVRLSQVHISSVLEGTQVEFLFANATVTFVTSPFLLELLLLFGGGGGSGVCIYTHRQRALGRQVPLRYGDEGQIADQALRKGLSGLSGLSG